MMLVDTSRARAGSRSQRRRQRALPPVLVLCLLSLLLIGPGHLLDAQPRIFDGHELPLDPGGPLLASEEAPGPGALLAAPMAVEVRLEAHEAVARGHVVVRFRDEVPEWQRESVSLGAGGRAYRPARWAEFARVEAEPDGPLEELLQSLRASPAVEWAGVDPVYSALGFEAAPAPSHQPINDPFFPFQWNLQHIRYHAALDLNPTRGRGVVVAVIDSGIALGSGASYPTRRGVDLEGVSFQQGIDFVDGGFPHDRGVRASGGPIATALRFGHGTFAAAQIAAGVNNGVAIAGIAPEVTLLPIRVFNLEGFTNASVVAEAINFAVAAGADVINLSLGGRQPFEPARQAVANAVAAGVVLVASAGNEANDPDAPPDVSFPARYDGVIAVGSSTFGRGRARYSNPGPSLDLMAPAGESPAIVQGQTRDAALSTSFVHDPATGDSLYGGFFATGTSFACPQVAAAAALLKAQGVRDPAAVLFTLLETTQDLGAPGFDEQTGHGLLDLLRAHQGFGFN